MEPSAITDAMRDELRAAQVASGVAEPLFVVPASISTALREGAHFDRWPDGRVDWSSDGLADLRKAGWSGTLASLPDVADVIAGRCAAPHPAATQPTTPLPVPPVAATPHAKVPIIAAKPVIDAAAIFASRAGRTDPASAGAAAAQVAHLEDDLAGAGSIAHLSARFWARHAKRAAAGRCGLTGLPLTGRVDGLVSAAPGAGFSSEKRAALAGTTRAATGLPDATELYARRRAAPPRS